MNMAACVFIAGATTSTDLDTQNPFQGTSMGNFDLFAACIPGLTLEPGTITIVKHADPADGTDFPFAGDLGSFTLDDAVPDDSDGFADTRTFDKPAGSYRVQELAPSGWSLDDIGCTTNDTDDTTVINVSSASVQIDLDYGEDVTCTFTNTEQFTLTVNRDGGGSGTVTSSPAGIFCGEDCTGYYVEDTVVTLTAHPGLKSYFVGWSGGCAGTENTTQVIMDDNKTCTATFGYPVGGVVVLVNKFELLLPWLGLAALISLAALTVALVRRRKV
jgi:hypothetical protein